MDKILGNIHYFVILYAAIATYNMYEEHELELEDLKSQIPALETNIDRRSRELEQLQRYFIDIEESRQNIELVAREVERVQQQLPSEISTTENITLIRTIAESLNIQKVTIEPLAEEDKGFYIVHRYRLRGEGTFLQYLIFFEKLEESQRLLNVGNLTIIRSETERRGRFQMVDGEVLIEAYRYNERHREDRGIEDVEQQFGS